MDKEEESRTSIGRNKGQTRPSVMEMEAHTIPPILYLSVPQILKATPITLPIKLVGLEGWGARPCFG